MWWNSDKYRIWGYSNLCNPLVAKTPLGGWGPPLTKILFSAFHNNLKSIPISFDAALFQSSLFTCKYSKNSLNGQILVVFFQKSALKRSKKYSWAIKMATSPANHWLYVNWVGFKIRGLFLRKCCKRMKLRHCRDNACVVRNQRNCWLPNFFPWRTRHALSLQNENSVSFATTSVVTSFNLLQHHGHISCQFVLIASCDGTKKIISVR